MRTKTLVNDVGRVCTCCLVFKPWSEFHKTTTTKRIQSRCKTCTNKDYNEKYGRKSKKIIEETKDKEKIERQNWVQKMNEENAKRESDCEYYLKDAGEIVDVYDPKKGFFADIFAKKLGRKSKNRKEKRSQI